ncbi:MAG: LEA type 2 family protein [Pseudomonadota bacterium]
MLKIINRPLFIAAIAALVTACSALNEVVKEPNVSVEGMQVKSVSLSDMVLDFTLGVENPNPVGISLSGLSYKLDVEDKSLLSGQSDNKLKVGANKSSSLHLPLQLKYQDVFGSMESLFKQDKIRYALSGELDFGLFRLPYSKQGMIDVPSLPSVKVNSVDIKGVTVSGLNVGIGLQVSNSNNFPIRLDGIDYGLKLADTTVASGKSLGALSLAPGEIGDMNIGLNLGYAELGGVINALKNNSRIPVAFDGQMKIPGADAVPLNWQGEVGIDR